MSRVKVQREPENLTRKQRRDHARARRKALEEAEAATALRRTRLRLLGIVVTVMVVGIVVVLLATGGGAKHGILASKTEQSSVVHEVSDLVGGIPQRANVLGAPTAPVTLQYFGDLECPVCRAFTLSALPSIIGRWVRGGELKIEYRSLETATREPEVFKAQQVAALAAGKQDRMWNFIETFYHEQGEEDSGYVTEGYIQGIASQVPGLNLMQWTSDRGDAVLASQLASDGQAASAANLNGTPAFLLGRSEGTMSKLEPSSFTEPGSFNEAIAKLAKS
jgi:protein-disulfide isomerase